MIIVDVVKNASQVPDFLRNLCILYEACPNLISTTEPQAVSHEHAKKHRDCSEQCHQFVKPETKTNQVLYEFRIIYFLRIYKTKS